MSSTNRKNAKERHKSDYYVTPQKCIKDFLDAFLEDKKSLSLDELLILDPCAGGDSQHPMSYPEVLIRDFGVKPLYLTTVDIREDSLAQWKGDFLRGSSGLDYDLIITNPPFNLAKEFITKSLEYVPDGGYVIMLLRLNFLGSKARKQFLIDHMPKYIYVHNRRMSFTDDGKTDSIEYMHAVWEKGYHPKYSLTRII